MKKAILAASFGTTFPDTLERTIAAIEADLAKAFPDRVLRRAFTSGMVIRRLQEREGLETDTVPQALERLRREGCGDIIIQPTHVMNGDEYDKLRALAAPYRTAFSRFALGAPLLTSTQDYRETAAALLARLPEQEPRQAVVLMGHGTAHHANAVYAALEYVLRDAGRRDIAIGTVEGYPEFGEICRRLEEMGDIRQVVCLPLMVVAGDHARNDLAGGEGSWCARLAARGYRVRCILEGLGENPAIRAIFVRHAREAAEYTPLTEEGTS